MITPDKEGDICHKHHIIIFNNSWRNTCKDRLHRLYLPLPSSLFSHGIESPNMTLALEMTVPVIGAIVEKWMISLQNNLIFKSAPTLLTNVNLSHIHICKYSTLTSQMVSPWNTGVCKHCWVIMFIMGIIVRMSWLFYTEHLLNSLPFTLLSCFMFNKQNKSCCYLSWSCQHMWALRSPSFFVQDNLLFVWRMSS